MLVTVSPNRFVLAAAALLATSACSSGTFSSVISPSRSAGPSAHAPASVALPPIANGPASSRPEPAGKALLYVANYGKNVVMIYDAAGHNQAPVGTITSGISGPEGMAVDAKQRLFVTNTKNNTVTVYARGGSTPIATYSTGVDGPDDVVVGDDKTVYVANLFTNEVVAYAHGSMTPTATYSGLNFIVGVTLDASNNLYVTDSKGVTKYPAGSTQGKNLGIPLQIASGIAVDQSGNLVVANQGDPRGVFVYPPGHTKPSHIFGKEGDPNPLVFSDDKKLVFVGEPMSNTVNVYAYPSGTKVNSITNGVRFPAGVAVSPRAPF